jgi:L-rhamnose mutarotase
MAIERAERPADEVRREAWVMWLKPGSEQIYKQKHDEIWPEMVEQMRSRGIRNYSIYRHGLTLFAYLERDETASSPDEPDPLMWRWWKMMEPYMECNSDGSPHRGEVQEMFHLD